MCLVYGAEIHELYVALCGECIGPGERNIGDSLGSHNDRWSWGCLMKGVRLARNIEKKARLTVELVSVKVLSTGIAFTSIKKSFIRKCFCWIW